MGKLNELVYVTFNNLEDNADAELLSHLYPLISKDATSGLQNIKCEQLRKLFQDFHDRFVITPCS